MEASAKVLIGWMNGEGEEKLKKFEKRGRGDADDDEFALFKLEVKEQRTHIQAFLHASTSDSMNHGVHLRDINECVKQVCSKIKKKKNFLGFRFFCSTAL